MSYRNYIKGLKRRKLTLGMFKGIFEEIEPSSKLTSCKYELRCGHGMNDFSKTVVTCQRNREDVLKELLIYVQSRQLGYKFGKLYNRPFQIHVTEKGCKKELLLDSRYHQDFILFLTDRKPKDYA